MIAVVPATDAAPFGVLGCIFTVVGVLVAGVLVEWGISWLVGRGRRR